MLDMVNGEIKPDNEVVFYDGFLTIICEEHEAEYSGFEKVKDAEWSVLRFCLTAPYDAPISLEDIAKMYPKVQKVIFDDSLKGYVFNYGNHRCEKDAEMWELVGTTLGYA